MLTNTYNTTLYTGVTSELETRVWKHKTKQYPKSFTAQYNLWKLVYFEGFKTMREAIAREKYIKGKTRKWKDELINKMNPDWNELIVDG